MVEKNPIIRGEGFSFFFYGFSILSFYFSLWIPFFASFRGHMDKYFGLI
jgi:hypothetical protein